MDKAKTQIILVGLSSILTQCMLKSAPKNRVRIIYFRLGIMLALAACGDDKNNEQDSQGNEVQNEAEAEAEAVSLDELTKEEYEQMTAEDLLVNVKDIKNLTPEEYA